MTTISDERLAEIVGAGVPCVPIEPWEVAHVVQELRSLRAQGGVASLEASPAPVSEEWKPIEEVWADPEVPFWVSEYDKSEPKTQHIGEVLVFGRKWEGSWDESPYSNDRPGAFSGEPDVFIATTYEGAPCWRVASAGPSDYDEYARPTHYKLKPKPPTAKGGQ